MSDYRYDDMLQRHFETHAKIAFWGAITRAAPAVANFAAKAGPAVANFGAKLKPGVDTIKNIGTKAWGAGKAVLPHAKNVGSFGFSAATGIPVPNAAGMAGSVANTAYTSATGKPVMASLREKGAAEYTFKAPAVYQFKSADWKHHALHASPYVGWLASQAADATGHHRLSKALSAGSYLGYAGLAGHEALTNPEERVTSGIDAAALLAMLAADAKRWSRKPPQGT